LHFGYSGVENFGCLLEVIRHLFVCLFLFPFGEMSLS
jgi:hypothetical protein